MPEDGGEARLGFLQGNQLDTEKKKQLMPEEVEVRTAFAIPGPAA